VVQDHQDYREYSDVVNESKTNPGQWFRPDQCCART
jgi:hypothetical protein